MIDGAQNSVACKALYFTKTPTVMLDKSAEFMEHEAVSVTKDGIRYLKDNDIPKKIAEKLAELPFIKKISNKYETFVWFSESKNLDGYKSWVKISHLKDGNDYLTTHYVVGKNFHGQEIARENLFQNIKDKKFMVM